MGAFSVQQEVTIIYRQKQWESLEISFCISHFLISSGVMDKAILIWLAVTKKRRAVWETASIKNIDGDQVSLHRM